MATLESSGDKSKVDDVDNVNGDKDAQPKSVINDATTESKKDDNVKDNEEQSNNDNDKKKNDKQVQADVQAKEEKEEAKG